MTPRPTNTDIIERVTRLEDKVSDLNSGLRGEISAFGTILMKLQRKFDAMEAVENYKKDLKKSELPAIYKDPAIQRIIIYSIFGLIVLLLAYKGVNLVKLL